METSFELELIGRAAPPHVMREGIELTDGAVDVIVQERGQREALVHGTNPHVVTWREKSPLWSMRCTCGRSAGGQLCAHAIAARVQDVRLSGDCEPDQWERFRRRIDALAALSSGWEGLAQFLADSHAAGDADASFAALRDARSLHGGLCVARALGAGAGPDLVSDFLVDLAADHGLDGLSAAGPTAIAVAEELVVDLGARLDDWPPGASAAALLRLIGSLRRAAARPADHRGLFWALTLACSAAGRLLADRLMDPDALAETLLRAESEAHSVDYPWIAVVFDRLGVSAPDLALAMLSRLASRPAEETSAGSSLISHRVRAETMLAAAESENLRAVLENWPGAPYGEYLVRLPRSWSPRPHLDLLRSARTADRVRWAPGWPQHNPGDPRGGRLIHQIHDVLPQHPMWGDIALGDLVMALARVGDAEAARDALLEHARSDSDSRHRPEFHRIWSAAGLGAGAEAAAEAVFGPRGEGSRAADLECLLETIANIPESVFCADVSAVRQGSSAALITAVLLEDAELSHATCIAEACALAEEVLAQHVDAVDDLRRFAEIDVEELGREIGESVVGGEDALRRAHGLARTIVRGDNALRSPHEIEGSGTDAWIGALCALPGAGPVTAGLFSLLLGSGAGPAEELLQSFVERALNRCAPDAADLVAQSFASEPRGEGIEAYLLALMVWQIYAGRRRD